MRQIEEIPTAELIKYPKNSRTHSITQIAKLSKSIKEFGFTNPILIDENNIIIAGHGRLDAAMSLRLDVVSCLRLIGLTASQKTAYIIADNQLAITGSDWNYELLASEIDLLKDANFDISVVGFSDVELAELIGNPEDGENKNKFRVSCENFNKKLSNADSCCEKVKAMLAEYNNR